MTTVCMQNLQSRQVVHVRQLLESAFRYAEDSQAGQAFEQIIRELLLGAKVSGAIKVHLHELAETREERRWEGSQFLQIL